MKTVPLLIRCAGLGVLALMLAASANVEATLRVWTGNGGMDNVWTNVLNWSGVAPVPGDDLQFPFGALHPNNVDNYTNGTTFNSIQFLHGGSGTAVSYDLSGNSIALNAGVSAVNNSSTFWINTVNNALILNSNQTFSTSLLTSLAFHGAINLNGNNLTFDTAASSPIDVHAVISGAGGLIKTNPGTLTLYSNNTYTGSTRLSDGTLTLSTTGGIPNSTNIALSATSANLSALYGLAVNSGQTLSGIGSVSANVLVLPGGVISPGNNGLGTLTVNENVNLNTGSTVSAALNGTNTGTDYSQLAVLGTVALDNATLALTLGYSPAIGDSFVVVTNAGTNAVVGTFSGLPEGTFFTNNGVSFRITYKGGDGNDVVLTRANPPLPLVVTTLADSGAGSLRGVLAEATNGNTIIFAPNVTGAIILTSGELVVTQSVAIAGPGPAILAVDGNAATRVFHITNGASVVISGLSVTNGIASGNFNAGGGIWNDHSILTLSNCTVTGSSASAGGGGINNDHSTLTVVNCTISGNSAPGVFGGGIYNNGSGGAATLTLMTSTLATNSAFDGAGIFNNGESSGTGTVTVATCTFSANTAANGGGIDNDGTANGNATLSVNASTFSGNSGGALLNSGAGATLDIGDTLLDAAAASANIANIAFGSVTSHGYNLSSDSGAGFLTNATDQVNTAPMIGPLANNGGPTFTHALSWGSPAIDKGKRDAIASVAFNADQRGMSRPIDFSSIANAPGGDGSDIGAVEFNAPAPSISIAAVTNTIQLQGVGLSNLTYSIRANTNLSTTNWPVIGSAPANAAGSFLFTDTNAPLYLMRFYRASYP